MEKKKGERNVFFFSVIFSIPPFREKMPVYIKAPKTVVHS